jgi:hypothetical protein
MTPAVSTVAEGDDDDDEYESETSGVDNPFAGKATARLNQKNAAREARRRKKADARRAAREDSDEDSFQAATTVPVATTTVPATTPGDGNVNGGADIDCDIDDDDDDDGGGKPAASATTVPVTTVPVATPAAVPVAAPGDGNGNVGANSDSDSSAAAATVPATTPHGDSNKKRRTSKPLTTTARVTNKKRRATPRKINGRCYIRRQELYHKCRPAQKPKLRGFPNNKLYYGTIVSGKAGKGYNVKFDEFPADDKCLVLTTNALKAVEPGAEEVPNDHASSVAEECATTKAKKKSHGKDSSDAFCLLSPEDLKKATSFDQKWGSGDEEVVKWEILADDEFIEDDPLKIPDRVEYKIDMEASEDMDFNEEFFDKWFPDVKGHAKIMDRFLTHPDCQWKNQVDRLNVKFHDEDAEDPDWKVKVCYTLLIAAASEVESGVDNLWEKGRSKTGRRDHPDFGKYMPRDQFKMFRAAAPFCWCDEEHWFMDKRDKPWDIFTPCLDKFNRKRKNLLKAVLVMLDESMSGWRPKTSKLGGLPNYTFEPRKPIPLGTMFRNGVECISGILVFQDVVMNPDMQNRKDYHGLPSSLPGGKTEISAHTAEVLRQVEGSGIEPGGWVGGDAWFGSVVTSVEVMKRFKVHSTKSLVSQQNGEQKK